MKKNLDEILIKEILQKGTEMTAPIDLSSRIIARWQLEEECIPFYIPVLPRLTWWILAFFFAGLFIWGFSKMSFSGVNTEVAILMEQIIENLEYSIVSNEGVVFPTIAVLVIMVLINAFLLKFRILQRWVLG